MIKKKQKTNEQTNKTKAPAELGYLFQWLFHVSPFQRMNGALKKFLFE